MSTLFDPATVDEKPRKLPGNVGQAPETPPESPVDRKVKCDTDPPTLPSRAYLSGPMRGIPEYNYPAFNWAAKWLRDRGYEVISPAEMDLEGCDASDPPSFFRRDINVLIELSKYPKPFIVLLDGWEKSEGSTIEVAVGQVLNIPIYKLVRGSREVSVCLSYMYTTHAPWKPPWLKPTFEDNCHTLASEADYLVHGPRSGSYGPPILDFSKTAALANVILTDKLKRPLSPEDIALFMVAIKLSREIHKHKRDNLVDMIGYILTLQSCIDWRRTHKKETTDAVHSAGEA